MRSVSSKIFSTHSELKLRTDVTAFRVNIVPAVIATDSACRILAAGAGLSASRAVLQQAAEPRRRR
jgi:hypothetical protein